MSAPAPEHTGTVTVVVPLPMTCAAGLIDTGSGIVTSDWTTPSPAGLIRVWFQGNRHNAVNLVRWADRVYCCADRMQTHYPTAALAALPRHEFTALGTYDTVTGAFAFPDPTHATTVLTGWLGHTPGDTDLHTTVGAHDARRHMAALRTGTPEQQMHARLLSQHGPLPYKGL